MVKEQDKTPWGHLVQPLLKTDELPSPMEPVLVMQSKPSRKSQRCLPLLNHFFLHKTPESLRCNGESQTPASDSMTHCHFPEPRPGIYNCM